MSAGSFIRPGLCSVTFRQLTTADIIALCRDCSVEGVEWGSDVHVRSGDSTTATDVRGRCRDAGVEVVSYGSYVWARNEPEDRCPVTGLSDEADDWSAALATALELGAPNIRVWAGTRPSGQSPPTQRSAVAAQLRRFASEACKLDLTISIEFHAGTLTDTAESAAALVDAVDHPALFTYWQPRDGLDDEAQLQQLRSVLPSLSHLHVFSWTDFFHRHALEHGERLWRPALGVAATPHRLPGARWALLEFVAGDDPEAFRADAATLRTWLGAESTP